MARRSGAESLVARATQAVRDHIRTNDLKVGDTLPGEGYFAESLGVSRAVIREAFGGLAALRLIDVGNGRRARVSAIDGTVMAASLDHAVATDQISLTDVWDVRRVLEMRTAALAATERSDEEAEQILTLARKMDSIGSTAGDVTDYDIAFHEAIARASRNALFVQIVTSFAPMMAVAVPAAWATRVVQESRPKILDLHVRLAEAIRDRNPEAASAAMAAHFDTAIIDQMRSRERVAA
jgi:GntR family transcriptional regulator, transcriptional repressor for pyruvate dehydrogenase complex